MAKRSSKATQLKDIAEKSRRWDADFFVRNFEREMAQLEQGLGHMVWDRDDHCVTPTLRPLPMTPRFQVTEDEKSFTLVVTLPGVHRDDIRVGVETNSVELYACTGDAVCKPYYISVDTNGKLVPSTADAKLSGDVFELKVTKAQKKRLKIK